MKKNNSLFVLIIILCIIGIITNIFLMSSNIFNKDFRIQTKKITINDKNYSIQITQIYSSDEILNNGIDTIINNIKSSFLEEVKNDKGKLVIDYEYSKYKDIYSFHIRGIANIKDILKRKDYIIYYDEKAKKVLKQEDLIKKDYGLYTIFNSNCVDYLKDIDYDESLLEIEDKNYSLLIFSKDNIQIIIINNNEEISIPINYSYIKEYLNKKYFRVREKIIKDTNKDVEVTPEREETIQENVDKTEELNLPKYLAFTFDDGPALDITTTLLDGLKERNAKATFFVLGNRAVNQGDIIKRMIEEGHVVGSHTYSHKNLLRLSLEETLGEINNTNDIIANITGNKPKYLRPPYGNYNKEILNNSNMTFILWSVDTEDWKKRNADLIYEYIINNVNDGDIVLLHDLYPTSVDGVLKAIDYLKGQNYRFVNIDELFNKKGAIAEVNKTYRYVK